MDAVKVRMWTVWSVGVLAYISAVLQRTSFGVAGLDAAHRFGTPAGIVATFVVVQLLVYALLQIPVGVLLDRFGSRLMITTGAIVMAMGQVSLAFADSVPEGIIARVLVGAGDAMTFSSVLRLVPAWFPARRVPVMTQITGLIGQSGQILSAVPFAALLHTAGWQPAFLACAAVAATAALAAGFALRNRPPGAAARATRPTADPVFAQIKAVWAHPGTRLGMWTHFTTCFAPMTFAMMWGFPYLVSGEGLSSATAGALMTLFVVAGLAFGPTLGVLTQRHPRRRSNLALSVIALNVVPWVLVLAWPGPAPLWLLVVLMIGLASGGPGSAIGFDFARTFVPAHRLGTATGIVIMGGFGGALVAILLAGLVLDLVGGAGAPGSGDVEGFRLAMATQLPLFAIGLVGLYRSRRATRARMAEQGIHVGPFITAARHRWWPHADD